jgi:hypothetical protein
MQPPAATRSPPPAPVEIPANKEAYMSLAAGGRLQGTFDLTSIADADEMIRAINLWKSLLKPLDSIKEPKDESAH